MTLQPTAMISVLLNSVKAKAKMTEFSSLFFISKQCTTTAITKAIFVGTHLSNQQFYCILHRIFSQLTHFKVFPPLRMQICSTTKGRSKGSPLTPVSLSGEENSQKSFCYFSLAAGPYFPAVARYLIFPSYRIGCLFPHMQYYKLLTSSFPSLPSTVHACSPPSAQLPGFFHADLHIYHRHNSLTERSLSEKAVREHQISILTPIEENMWSLCFSSLLLFHPRQNDLYRHTLVTYIYYEERLRSVNVLLFQWVEIRTPMMK